MGTLVLQKKNDISRWAGRLKTPVMNIGLICLGNVIFTIGMNGIMIPHGLLSGGSLGIALIIHYLFNHIEIGLAYLLINIPLLMLGWYYISLKFLVYTIFSTLFFSLTADLFQPGAFPITDPMLASVFSGIVCGAGAGIILLSVGSGGGMDVVGICLNRKFGLPIGPTLFLVNTSALIVGIYFYDFQILLYSVIYLFVYGKTLEMVTSGWNKRKSLTVISDMADMIAQRILQDNGRGVTFLKGEGAFSGTDKRVIYTITSMTELPKIKELIMNIDPGAFMVVNDAVEVSGTRYGKRKGW